MADAALEDEEPARRRAVGCGPGRCIERAAGVDRERGHVGGRVVQGGMPEKVAQRLGKSGAWVSQPLALLELPEDLQQKVESGELKVKDGRRLGRLSGEEQRVEADKGLNRVKTPRKLRSRKVPEQAPSTGDSAPNQEEASAPTPNPVTAPDGGSESQSPSPLNRVKAPGETGPLAQLELYVVRACEFADAVPAATEAYTAATGVDHAHVAELASQFSAHLTRAMNGFPAA